MKRKVFTYKMPIYILFFLMSVTFIVPFFMLISISFSNEQDVLNYGYSLIPRNFTTEAYRYLFDNPKMLVNSYLITVFYAFAGTLISIIVEALAGFALAQKHFAYKKFVTAFLVATMLFSGGIVPSYLLNTQVYKLQDNILIYMVSGMVSAYTIFVFKSFFQGIPEELSESARLDGASDFKVLWHVVLPLSLPVLATFYMMGLLSRWNNFEVSLYYANKQELWTLQYYLQQILNEAKVIRDMIQEMPGMSAAEIPPAEIIKYVVCVLGTIPMMVVFPFFQKYFSKGMTLGAVKG